MVICLLLLILKSESEPYKAILDRSIAFFKQKSHIEIPDKIDGILLKTFSLR